MGAPSCILIDMRPTPEQVARARKIAPNVQIEDGRYIIHRGRRRRVTGALYATDAIIDIYGLEDHDVVVAELALDEALDNSREP